MRRRERLLSNGPSSGKRPSRGIHFEERKAPCELAKKSRAKRPASRFNYWCDLELTSCPSVKPQFNHVLINNWGPKIKMEIILYPFIVIAFLTGKFIFFSKSKTFFPLKLNLQIAKLDVVYAYLIWKEGSGCHFSMSKILNRRSLFKRKGGKVCKLSIQERKEKTCERVLISSHLIFCGIKWILVKHERIW